MNLKKKLACTVQRTTQVAGCFLRALLKSAFYLRKLHQSLENHRHKCMGTKAIVFTFLGKKKSDYSQASFSCIPCTWSIGKSKTLLKQHLKMNINTWESQQITTTNILFIIQQAISSNCMRQVILWFITSANHLVLLQYSSPRPK